LVVEGGFLEKKKKVKKVVVEHRPRLTKQLLSWNGEPQRDEAWLYGAQPWLAAFFAAPNQPDVS